MKAVLFIVGGCVVAFVGVMSYRVDTQVGIFAIGVMFGILAGVPMALLVLAATRRNEQRQPQQPQQPIFFMGGGPLQQPSQPTYDVVDGQFDLPALPAPKEERIKYTEW